MTPGSPADRHPPTGQGQPPSREQPGGRPGPKRPTPQRQAGPGRGPFPLRAPGLTTATCDHTGQHAGKDAFRSTGGGSDPPHIGPHRPQVVLVLVLVLVLVVVVAADVLLRVVVGGRRIIKNIIVRRLKTNNLI